MVGRAYASTAAVSALSGRCPRISVPDPRLLRFPRPLSEPCMRFSRTRLSPEPASGLPPGAVAPSRSPSCGADSHSARPQRARLRPRVRLPGLPSVGVLLSPHLVTVLCPAPTPSRQAVVRAEEGLSSSPTDCPCMPRPLHRRVLGGCTSQVFPASVAFAHLCRARLPLVRPWPGGITMRQTSRNAAACRFARRPQDGFDRGLRRPDFAGRRRSATRRLGPYRDRTFTGKLVGA